jgi:hypothetical protein
MHELGNLINEYRGSAWRYIAATTLTGLMTIGAVWAIVEMKPADPGKASLVVVLFGVITVVFAFVAKRDGASRLSLHERGVVYQRGEKRSLVRYDEIARAQETRVNGKVATLHLQLRRGGEVRIAARLENYDHAVQSIAARV